MFVRLLFTSLLAFFSGAAPATEYRAGALQIDTPWSRALPPNAPAGAVYFTVKNGSQTADRLVDASTPSAAKTELHTHLRVGEVMRMQRIDAIAIPAGTEVKLEPGGHHVMFFNLKRPLAAGEHFPLTLEFEKAGKVEIEVEVRSDAPASEGHEHH
ncbi:copper chaperone PCu(A)C [Azotobacter salinestris]|uniref:copper chaperone PCu(A)C n=1 Tax=Azotobacter salinestris TaxID=69964 RepID=UPI001266DE3D|nr:copper chaperone PCu(A)C [Azotobacter salinestris]